MFIPRNKLNTSIIERYRKRRRTFQLKFVVVNDFKEVGITDVFGDTAAL